ncbi:hypothetical protein HMPREF2715_09365 [Staphylococcus sp. HMSC062A01]|nr:hypothetical protein [Staphylococcus sp. HMSC062A01]OHP66973.1 hypothetical protein HMPREF2715_09365 [Staphylococcus sp. HMSC062A01]
MDKKKIIKTAINVLPIIIVPLVVERKRIKSHPEVQKATHATTNAGQAIANKATGAKEYLGDKKQEFDNKRELKKIAKENDPEYIQKKGEKLAKKNYKEADKMNKKLQKNIDKRHKEEEKLQKQEEKARIKEMKKFKDHEAESVVTQNKNEDNNKA